MSAYVPSREILAELMKLNLAAVPIPSVLVVAAAPRVLDPASTLVVPVDMEYLNMVCSLAT
jgi:hypothetical protein